MNLDIANNASKAVVLCMEKDVAFKGKLRTGVDLGTAYTVCVAVDDNNTPVACAMRFAQVIKDGLVVDYSGACQIVRELKATIEKRTGVILDKAAIAVPPGTASKNTQTHAYVVESAGFEVTSVVDEPVAANTVIGMKNGVIVDIGGGTTGLAVLKDSKVVYTADEATGGTHVSLVLAGHYKVSFEEAEEMKKNIFRHKEFFGVIRPVFDKMASIVENHIKGYDVDEICLVGGTCLFEGIEDVFEKRLGIKTFKPENPFLITPLGIALNCGGLKSAASAHKQSSR